MFSSQTQKSNLIFSIYQDFRTVYRLIDIAMLTFETDFESLNKRLNYAVKTGKLLNPRQGVYAKPSYKPEEMACRIFTPSYISLEYVLQKKGIIFQYKSQITSISYLNRSIEIESNGYEYRKIKGEIMVDTRGIIRYENGVNIATAERAFLDTLYLNGDTYFDNTKLLDLKMIEFILPIYNSAKLNQRVKKILKHG
jgi:hypothetical protein